MLDSAPVEDAITGSVTALRPLVARLLACIFVVAMPATAMAQVVPTSAPPAKIVQEWNRGLEGVDQYLKQPSYSEAKTKQLHDLLERIRSETKKIEREAQDQLDTAQRLLQALGPPPTGEQLSEPAEIGDKRTKYQNDIRDYKARTQQAQLARTRADELDGRLSAATTTRLVDELLTREPLLYTGRTLKTAMRDYGTLIKDVAAAPGEWWHGLPDEYRKFGGILLAMLLLVVAVLVGFLLRYWLLRRFGRDPAEEHPSYSRRFVAALAEATARGIVPALIFAAVLLRIKSEDPSVAGLLTDTIAALCVALIFLFLSVALIQAVLAPDMPAWRLASLKRQHAATIGRRAMAIVAVIALDGFIRNVAADVAVTDAFWAVQKIISGTIENMLILLLVQRGLWQLEPIERQAAEGETTPDEEPKPSRFWASVRTLILVMAVSGIIAFAAAYVQLGDYINTALTYSALVAASLYLLRGLLREAVGIATRSEFARQHLALHHSTRSTLKFWLRSLLDTALMVTAVVVLLVIWGVPAADLSRWVADAFSGFKIGSVTISIADIVTALFVFAVVLTVTRMLQRALSDRVLPETHLELGVQSSLAAGFGYLGIILAVTLTLTTLGIDLSNIALIAGALSVGIGFGLQNVVNNFVSGLILLIERPVQVGDWVAVASHEGRVKRISVRATEIETFQRASVIIPNAELISNAVQNWTHKNTVGRVEIRVGVAYGTDTAKVRDILLNCATQHEEVHAFPEPFVLFWDFGESSLDFELRCFIGDVIRRRRVASDIRFEIDRCFREEGIEIPFPQRVVHMVPSSAGAAETGNS